MKRPVVTLSRSLAVVIARAAAAVPRERRPAFLKGVVASLRGLSRPDANAVAQACWTQWRLCGVIPRSAPKAGHAFAFPKRRAA